MNNLRKDFPILEKKIHGKPLVYFDNAATTHKPQAVIDAIVEFYTEHNANIGRSIHTLGEEATQMYEDARTKVAHFINARSSAEVVFTGGATESINIVAATWAEKHVQAGDEIVVSELEHHANLLPWQRVAQKNGAKLVFIPVNFDGTLQLDRLSHVLSEKTKLVAITHSSNALGTHNDISVIVAQAHAVGAKVLVDAAQSAPHQAIDVQQLGCDFLAFSAHKMMGPTGIGVLYVAQSLHDQLVPYRLGGGMVYEADYHTARWLPMPQLLEAGTLFTAQAIGLAAAIDYLQKKVEFTALQKHESALCARLIDGLVSLPQITILGPVEQLKKTGHLVSFLVDGIHPHDVAAYLDQHGICVRAGHHCAQPLAKKLGVDASVRASFYCYNTLDEVDFLVDVLRQLVQSAH